MTTVLRPLWLIAVCALGAGAGRADTFSSVSIGTALTAGGVATGVVVVQPLIGTGLNHPEGVGTALTGLQYVAGQVPLDGSPASTAFYTLSGAALLGGSGNPAGAFASLGTLTQPTTITAYPNVSAKLMPAAYSGLTYAATDLGFGPGVFYAVHHHGATDYLAALVPSTGTASTVTDLKPMSWIGPGAGGPASLGTSGYFGLAAATGLLASGAPYADQSLYYLRTNQIYHTIFGLLNPAPGSPALDAIDLTAAVGGYGIGGYSALAFSPAPVGPYGPNRFYYLRRDALTGNSVLGWLDPGLAPGIRTVSDIANLGGVFTALTFSADATGPGGAWGTSRFYLVGNAAPDAQSLSFAAIPAHSVGDVFSVVPTASSGLDVDLTVVSGPATVQQSGVSGAAPSQRIFTVTTLGVGTVTLQARQAGRSTTPTVAPNLLQQSFAVLGSPVVAAPFAVAATVGIAFHVQLTGLGGVSLYTAAPLPPGLAIAQDTGVISGTPTTVGTTTVLLSVTNSRGVGHATLIVTVGPASAAPIISNYPLTGAGTLGSVFALAITASGLPTSFSASPLPPGLILNPATGIIIGSPTALGTTYVLLGATNANGTGNATLVITVGPADAAPLITNTPLTAPGTVGVPFIFAVTASGLPTVYGADPLPPGLTMVPSTGLITGVPTTAGTTNVAISAGNSLGIGSSILAITVAPASSPPIIANSSLAASGLVGVPFAFSIAATGLPSSYSAAGLPTGLTLVAATGVITGTPSGFGVTRVLVSATNASGTGSAALMITITEAGVAPVLTVMPTSLSLARGDSASFFAGATGSPAPTFQWYLNGLPLPGATSATLTRNSVQPADAGIYTVVASNAAGSAVSLGAVLTIDVCRIVNLSALASTGAGNQALTLGFVVSGEKQLLLRGGGPGLTAFGVSSALADPQLTLFSGAVPLASDAGWQSGGDAASISELTARFGAFALAPGSPDSALVATLVPGAYTVQLTGLGNTSGGAALAEVYDVDARTGPRLLNASARLQVTTAAGPTISTVGFIIQGNGTKTLLLRGVGPGLAQFGISGLLPDPRLSVLADGVVLATNAGWQNGLEAAQIADAGTQSGAFPLQPGSADSAFTLTLPPGSYTLQLGSVSGRSGVALLEVYDIQ